MSPFDPAGRRDRRARGRTRGSGQSAGRGAGPPEDAARRFSLYVEGPRDGDILRVWARRVCPAMVRPLERCMVILGGRQPARAVEHFRSAGGEASGRSGLVVLDRDHHAADDPVLPTEPGLELFTWSRRHIESYVLVRDAIQRVVAEHPDREWLDRLIERHVPPAHDEEACSGLDAKRLLGAKGALARELGQVVSPAAVARTMRLEELHTDVLSLLDRIRGALGLAADGLQVVKRTPRVDT